MVPHVCVVVKPLLADQVTGKASPFVGVFFLLQQLLMHLFVVIDCTLAVLLEVRYELSVPMHPFKVLSLEGRPRSRFAILLKLSKHFVQSLEQLILGALLPIPQVDGSKEKGLPLEEYFCRVAYVKLSQKLKCALVIFVLKGGFRDKEYFFW